MIWRPIEAPRGFSVSNEGQVRIDSRDRVLKQHINTGGTVYVTLYDGRNHIRSVAKLVARAFLDDPPRPTFDTPIHLDGDPWNNHVFNLMWRPKWFAHKYRSQFTGVHRESRAWVKIRETGEVILAWEAAMRYGLLVGQVIVASSTQDESSKVPLFSPHSFEIPRLHTISAENRSI